MRKDVLPSVGYAILGLIIGLAVSALAAGMVGAGHGWSSAGISAISIIAAPLTGIAWGFRRHRWSLWLSLLLIVAGITVDFLLVLMTRNEGINYAQKVLSIMADQVVLWALLFMSWQLWALASAITTMRTVTRSRGRKES